MLTKIYRTFNFCKHFLNLPRKTVPLIHYLTGGGHECEGELVPGREGDDVCVDPAQERQAHFFTCTHTHTQQSFNVVKNPVLRIHDPVLF
jgi:hypothetical protein